MFARAFLLRVTLGVAAGVDLVAFVAFADFAATLLRLIVFRHFLGSLRFLHCCSLHGTREPYACRERSKAKLNEVLTWQLIQTYPILPYHSHTDDYTGGGSHQAPVFGRVVTWPVCPILDLDSLFATDRRNTHFVDQ